MKLKIFKHGVIRCVTVTICLFTTTGKVQSQNAISFQSPGDYMEVPHHATLAPSQFTIEFWLKVNDTGDPDAAGGEQTILDKRDGETGYNFRLAGTAFPLPVFGLVLPGDASMYDVIRRSTWHHIAVTQGDDTAKIYLNGALQNSNPNTYSGNTAAPLRIGEFLGYPGAYLGLRGELDDLRIWNYPRSQGEIMATMHEKLSGTETGLAAYWDFDTIVGNVISDLSANGNDGNIYGGVTLVESDAPIGFIPPAPPVGLRSYGGENHVKLAWKPVDGDIESYRIYRGDSAAFLAGASSFLAEVDSPESSYIDTTVVPGTNYYYCVRSSENSHLSTPGAVALGRTLAAAGDYETGTYYYPWYGPAEEMHEWEGQYVRDYLIPQQPPMLGHYSSRNPQVIRQHLTWMEACGIDFAVMSWWGINSREDITLRDHIGGEIANSSVKFSIYYESAKLGFSQDGIHIDELEEEQLVADFHYIADTYFDHPNYLRINDNPVVFLYLSGIYSGNFKQAFARIRSELSAKGFELYLIGDEVGWYEASGSHMEFLDAVSPYIILPRKIEQGAYPGNGNFFADLSVRMGEWENTAHPLGLVVIPGVNPGFSNRTGSSSGFAVPRQIDSGDSGTSLLEEYIKVALSFVEPEQRMIMITSWNEWHEDTQVEPTVVTQATRQDISAGGDYHTWNFEYEGYGFQNLELIRTLLASELPETDFTISTGSPIERTGRWEIYPNPTHGAIRIEAEQSGMYLIELYAINGQLLYNKQFEGTYHQVDLSSLPKGIYFITIRSKVAVVTRKVIKAL
jgi:hypothetical protein